MPTDEINNHPRAKTSLFILVWTRLFFVRLKKLCLDGRV